MRTDDGRTVSYMIRGYSIIIIIGLLLTAFAYPVNSVASDYALAMPTYFDGKCSVVIWIHGKTESRKIEYKGTLDETLCHVEVTKSEFEKNFKYCMLSGLSVDTTKSYTTQFGGGPAGDREIYWFEWRPAGEVHPTFYCFFNKH